VVVVVCVGVALLELVDDAAAAVAPIEIAAGTAMPVAVAAVPVATVAAPVAWPPAAAPAGAPGACAIGATGVVCATATPAATIADNKNTNLMATPQK